MGTFQDLYEEGVLVLIHDYRAGHLLDISGQGNAGVAASVMWGNGLQFPATASKVTVADAAELQLTTGTLMVLGEFIAQGTESLVVKRDAGGTNYDLNLTAANVQLYDGTNTRTLAVSVIGKRCIAVNMGDGTTGEVFLDGISAGALDAASAVSVDNADLLIGNDHDDGDNTTATIRAVIIVNRKLTATEHAALYAEFEATIWPAKAYSRATASVGAELFIDGNQEAATAGAYTAGNAATLSKQSGAALSESQVLRVAYNTTADPFASQTVLTVGADSITEGWARGDATYLPSVKTDDGTTLWVGTTSTTWQYYRIRFVAAGTKLELHSDATGAGYCEFDNVSVKEARGDEAQLKTSWGVHAGGANKTAGSLENSPFEIVSGTHQVISNFILGDVYKHTGTAVAGILALDGNLFHADPTLAAYGTWDFWVYKANASAIAIAVVAQALTGITAGDYVLAIDASEVVTLGISGGATLITGAMPHSEFVHIKITRRQSDGLFELFISDISAGTAANTSLTTGAGMLFDLDVGDSLALTDTHGNYALTKYLGVV